MSKTLVVSSRRRRARPTRSIIVSSNRRTQSRQQDPAGMSTTRVSGPPHPKTLSSDISLFHTFQISGVVNSEESVLLNPLVLAAAFPKLPSSSTPIFDRFRVIKYSLYGPSEDVGMTFTLGGLDSFNSDAATFQDFGVAGSRRSAIHIRPAFAYRQEWFDSTNTSTIGTFHAVGTSDVSKPYVLQFTVETRSIVT